jgi:acylaminoacyl-peptidase
MRKLSLLILALALWSQPAAAQSDAADRFQLADVFQLELAADPQISPDGSKIVYVRSFMDIMTDRRRSNLWIIDYDGTDHRPLTTGNANYSSPRWSPDGSRLLYVSSADGSSQIYVRFMDDGQTAKLTNLQMSPSSITWSPDGEWIALEMMVPQPAKPMVQLPPKPPGAEWAKPAMYIDRTIYRIDGVGYLPSGYTHLFVLPAEGGTPRQITSDDYNYGGPLSWSPDGRSIIFSANLSEDWEYDTGNSEVYEVSVDDGSITALTDRKGPDGGPALSPDGSTIAYTGFDDRYQGYQVSHLYVMNRDGSGRRMLAGDLDRDPQGLKWKSDGSGVYFQYDDLGNTKIAFADLNGNVTTFVGNVGGLSLGRPYGGGQFSLSSNGRFAYTESRPDHPADVAVARDGSTEGTRLTSLNEDLFGHKQLGAVEEIWYESSYDGRQIQGWIVTPPDFDPTKKYPLILEIHGGPFANYGDRFAAEIQIYAAAGYVVLYTNPRGSTSYGAEFGNLIHHAYPGNDFHDLMSGVDAVIDRGYIEEENLFITGGSGGGVLSSWAVGHTDRFAAAVVQKPVINWYSFVLTSDFYTNFTQYWFPGNPWDNLDHYMKRSPISYVGNVTTPTMLITGEADHRTPISESEQFYQALRLQKVPAALVRIPDAPHGIANRPSNLITKVAYILAWFDKYRSKDVPTSE